MSGIQQQSNDGRRETRRPSLFLALGLLGGVLMVAALLFWMMQSRPDAVVVDQKDVNSQLVASDATNSFAEETNDRSVAPVAEPNALVAKRDPLSEQLTGLLWNLKNQTDSNIREQLIAAFVKQVSVMDISKVLDCLRGKNDRAVLELGSRLASGWAEVDPRAVADWSAAQPEGSLRTAIMDQALLAWTEVNWETAAAWARQLPAGAEHNRILGLVARELIRSEPMEALRIAVELRADASRDELVRHAAMEWASQDAATAVEWASKIPDGDLRAQVLSAVAISWAEQDIQSAATLAVRELPPGRLQSDTIVSIVNRWVQVDPVAAKNWVMQFPDGELKDDAMKSLESIKEIQTGER